MTFHVPEKYRVKTGEYASDSNAGNYGMFLIRSLKTPRPLLTIASDEAAPWSTLAWEHVSVSVPGQKRCPTWEEMSFIKGLFWDAEDAVVQFHPPASEYVNCHPFTLHLWRPVGIEIPRPSKEMVGPV